MTFIYTSEARFCDTNNILLVLPPIKETSLLKDFYGSVLTLGDLSLGSYNFLRKTVYLCGDLSALAKLDLKAAERVFVIRELSSVTSGDEAVSWPFVEVGQVPIFIHGVGVYYRRFFDPQIDYFDCISTEHAFQSLTESNKPGTAYRTGIYLTPVTQEEDALHFRLLRCSTNFSGPTENFRANDNHIVDALNQEASRIFENQAPLNHVLAQIYHNNPANDEHKQTKAKISEHADKTKDMPINGVMAFCTFYSQLDKLHPLSKDPFDYGYQETSGLTKLHFRLKEPTVPANKKLPQHFTLTLYPNSVFFMPLSTNRLYTHEIRSSVLDAERLPTRLGYVVRCSQTEAVHKQDQTFIKKSDTLIKLEPPTQEGMHELRKLYATENRTQAFIDYGDKFLFSMNSGDYLAPKYKASDEFRTYALPSHDNLFEELLASAQFEEVGPGRQGAVLVCPEETGAVPIVRTTTRYKIPAQTFHVVHEHLAQQIQKRASITPRFNNALLERYSNTYTTMGSHSDQALDLAGESYIAVFSCYQYPERVTSLRKLVIESKTQQGTFEIPLAHNCVVVFSVDTNRRFKHKIVLDKTASMLENSWLGLTFRTSKTFVRYTSKQAHFSDGTPMTLANEEETKQFFKWRGQENNETNFAYPSLMFTLSQSDFMQPTRGPQKEAGVSVA